MQGRVEWIDIAKGLGMLIVIAGHTISLRYSYPLYAFHMPLFFFLSGLVFKNRDENFISFFIRITKSLLKPWLVMLFISLLVCLLIPQWRCSLSLLNIFIDFYTANTNTLQNSSLWYLVCFYFVLLLFYIINRNEIRYLLIRIIIFITFAWTLLYIREVLSLFLLPFHRLPFKIDSALVALIFFIVAYSYKERILSAFSKRTKIGYVLILVVLTALLSVFNGWSNINSLDFGKIRLLYYPIAFLGIGTVCLVSQYIYSIKCRPLNSLLVFYGKNSLLIFGFQSLFIRLYLLFFNNVQGLNMNLYGDNPVAHQIGSFMIVSFVLSPMMVFLFGYLRTKHIKIL